MLHLRNTIHISLNIKPPSRGMYQCLFSLAAFCGDIDKSLERLLQESQPCLVREASRGLLKLILRPLMAWEDVAGFG